MISNDGLCNSLQVSPDGSQVPLAYRYRVTANATVNSFKPKELCEADKANLRSASFGALFCGRFSQLPRATHCGVIWEAQVLNHSLFESIIVPNKMVPIIPHMFV